MSADLPTVFASSGAITMLRVRAANNRGVCLPQYLISRMFLFCQRGEGWIKEREESD